VNWVLPPEMAQSLQTIEFNRILFVQLFL
jgi:hypothetical protein